MASDFQQIEVQIPFGYYYFPVHLLFELALSVELHVLEGVVAWVEEGTLHGHHFHQL